MLQTIIVILIISFALAYSIYAIVKSLFLKKKTNGNPCDGCTGCDAKKDLNCSAKKTIQP